MTFRELINHVMNRGASLHVYATISDTHYKGKHLNEVCDKFTDVIRELLELPEGPVSDDINSDYFLRLKTIPYLDDTEGPDVVLYDSAEDKEYACDFTEWVDLIDLQVEDKIGLPLDSILAHILYEITFWGWNADQISEERTKLIKQADEETDLLRVDSLSGFLDSI